MLVVGATGYIGKFVVRELVKRRYDVVALARERSGVGGKATRDDVQRVRAWHMGFVGLDFIKVVVAAALCSSLACLQGCGRACGENGMRAGGCTACAWYRPHI